MNLNEKSPSRTHSCVRKVNREIAKPPKKHGYDHPVLKVCIKTKNKFFNDDFISEKNWRLSFKMRIQIA
jgi:hypothetical protein